MMSTFVPQGYFQTSIRPGDEPLSAFVCDDGVFEFLRTPFGGKACGATFMSAVQKVIEPVQNFTESFVDDVIVHSRSINGDNIFSTRLRHVD